MDRNYEPLANYSHLLKTLLYKQRVSLEAIEEDILYIYAGSKQTRLDISEFVIGIRYALMAKGKGRRVVKQRQLGSCEVSPTRQSSRRHGSSSLSLLPHEEKVASSIPGGKTSSFSRDGGKDSSLKLHKTNQIITYSVEMNKKHLKIRAVHY